jgi:ubiquinone/menaquinone biosynthesis C-methylase UbiE
LCLCVDCREVAARGDPEYALSASSEDEHERLGRQADWYAPFTRRLLERAGIESGMRVLDVGCGPGDVSFLVAERVGRDGMVVGVERDEQALATARRRAVESGHENVELVLGDFREVEFAGGPFDAVVGRLVLMYQGDPAAAVASVANHVRPGGVVVFAEMSVHLDSFLPERCMVSWPPTPASEQLNEWIHATHSRLGTQPDMGMRLPATFAQAGLLPNPDLDSEVAIGVGEEAIRRIVDLTRSFLPGILATGVATEEEVDLDTLAERLRADTGPVGRVMFWPTVVGAFATKPA